MARSRWKVPFISSIFFRKKFLKSKTFNTFSRNSLVGINFVDKRLRVYNGLRFISFVVKRSMLGKKLGEFSASKILGSNIALSKHLKMKAKKKKK